MGKWPQTATCQYCGRGFPYSWRKNPKTQQVARCGNSVCPPITKALVEANLPEMCPGATDDMTSAEA